MRVGLWQLCVAACLPVSGCALPSRLLHGDRQAPVCFCAHIISQPAGLLERAELSFEWRLVAALRGHAPSRSLLLY